MTCYLREHLICLTSDPQFVCFCCADDNLSEDDLNECEKEDGLDAEDQSQALSEQVKKKKKSSKGLSARYNITPALSIVWIMFVFTLRFEIYKRKWFNEDNLLEWFNWLEFLNDLASDHFIYYVRKEQFLLLLCPCRIESCKQ